MRTEQEIEARLALILANSFRNIRVLNWDSFDGKTARIKVRSENNDGYLIVLDHVGSGLVRLNGSPYFELDAYHRMIPLPPGENSLEIEFSPFMDFGERVNINPGKPFQVDLVRDAYRLWAYGEQAMELTRVFKDEELKSDIYALLTDILKEVPFTSASKEQILLALKLGKWGGWFGSVEQIIEQDLVEIYTEGGHSPEVYKRGLEKLINGLSNLVAKYGKRGKLVGVGHAHIDTAWLWNFDETRRKVLRTFSTILTLLDKYKDFTFVQSASIYYEWIKEDAPQLFEKIKEKVNEGKWQLAASYVESDTNVTSGESLARQLLYSQRFYLQNFGKLAQVYWLPDTFGYNANLPQIAKLAGIKAFATHKVFWYDTNKFPYNVFYWVGPDGSKIPTITFGAGKGGYNSDFSASSVYDQWKNWAEKDQPMLYSYGYGDGGGGPNEQMLIFAEAVDKLPILPKVSLGGIEEEIKEISPKDEWRGELYVETHRGTYTSHSLMKLLNRRAEIALREAELWCTLAKSYDKSTFTSLWKTLLKDQFHDVLPGSAIRDVYKTVYPELQEVIKKANSTAEDCMRKIAGEGNELLVFNSLPWDREEIIFIDQEIEGCQKIGNLCAINVRAPSVGYAKLVAEPVLPPVSVKEEGENYVLENKYLRVIIGKDGLVRSIYDKEAEREVLSKYSNEIIAYENIPGWADAWDIEKGYKETSFNITAKSSQIISTGPLVASVKFTYEFRRSKIVQEVRMFANSRRIDFVTTIGMKDRELVVKSWFHFDLNVDKAVSDIPFGVIERPTTKNTSWEQAKFEVPIQKFIDLSEHNYGVAVLNDGKYGVSAEGSSIGLTLTKTPIYPDPSTDLEEVTFTYSVYPHIGDWKEANVIRKAYELNVPLRVIRGKGGEAKSFLKIDSPNIILEAIKGAEDDNAIVLRLYEVFNARGKATIEFADKVIKLASTDLLELNNIDRDFAIIDNKVIIQYRNREIITLKVYL